MLAYDLMLNIIDVFNLTLYNTILNNKLLMLNLLGLIRSVRFFLNEYPAFVTHNLVKF